MATVVRAKACIFSEALVIIACARWDSILGLVV